MRTTLSTAVKSYYILLFLPEPAITLVYILFKRVMFLQTKVNFKLPFPTTTQIIISYITTCYFQLFCPLNKF